MEVRIGFAVTADGIAHELKVSEAVGKAYDIMVADNVPADTAAQMAVDCECGGMDPIAFAEEFVRGRKAIRRV
jgi:hypothetical protein